MSGLQEHIERAERKRTDLDGATNPGEPNAYCADAGEFAARWNEHTVETRDEWVRRHNEYSQRHMACFAADHEGHIQYLQEENARLREVLHNASMDAGLNGRLGERLAPYRRVEAEEWWHRY